jgi:putative ABC transport system permease protein
LRALGDNPKLLMQLGYSQEYYRLAGFAFTNMLAATSGALTAQTMGYADIGMGFGMTLTGIGAIILGQQIIKIIYRKQHMRTAIEFLSCLVGVMIYFLSINILLRLNVDPLYLKMVLGGILILFLRTALRPKPFGG